MPWEMDVLEISGTSGTVLLGHGKQRPRAGGKEQGTGWEGPELCLEGLCPPTPEGPEGGGEKVSAPPSEAALDSTAEREPLP